MDYLLYGRRSRHEEEDMSDVGGRPCRVIVLGLTCPESSLDYLTLRRRAIRDIIEFTGTRKRTSALLVDDDL